MLEGNENPVYLARGKTGHLVQISIYLTSLIKIIISTPLMTDDQDYYATLFLAKPQHHALSNLYFHL